ncbi:MULTISPECIES: hypothetical protein [unclassified Carboxylicivirga]|uniref:hypothetical protein n=1 Tax=Carboxylicivirga TaxID=1628153 RepID=UPI003D340CD3
MTPKLTLLALLIICLQAPAQKKYEQRADKYYKYFNYEKARKDYIRVWRRDKDNKDLLNKIIDCYLSDNTLREEAMPYIEHLLKLKPNDEQALLYKAQALFHAHEFSKAETLLNALLPCLSGQSEALKQATTLKANIANAQTLIKQPIDVTFINPGNHINTRRNEVSPFITQDEHTLFYSSDKRYNSYAGIYYYNICAAQKYKLDFEKGKTIGSQLNSIYDEMVAGISPDGNQLFAFHNRDGAETMGYAIHKGNLRFEPMADFGPPLDARGAEYGVWMTTGKDTILFASESESGLTDLYYAIRLPSGEWGEARLLPGAVNSANYNENFPVLALNGQRLYFSSDNEQSMGGYDLFYADWDPTQKQWGKPINMGYPINDTYDNYNISWVQDKRFAYVSAIRPGGEGKYDIYKVVFNNTEPYNAVIKCDIRLKQERRRVIPGFCPDVIVTDTLDNMVGRYQVSRDSAKFVLALTAGAYRIHIQHDNIEPLVHELIIPDNRYEAVADRIRLVIIPRQKEMTLK